MTALLAGIWEGSRLLFASLFFASSGLNFCRQTKIQRVISARSQHKDSPRIIFVSWTSRWIEE